MFEGSEDMWLPKEPDPNRLSGLWHDLADSTRSHLSFAFSSRKPALAETIMRVQDRDMILKLRQTHDPLRPLIIKHGLRVPNLTKKKRVKGVAAPAELTADLLEQLPPQDAQTVAEFLVWDYVERTIELAKECLNESEPENGFIPGYDSMWDQLEDEFELSQDFYFVHLQNMQHDLRRLYTMVSERRIHSY